MKEKNFASLGSSLLARKGGAKPAMRRLNGAVSPEQDEEAQLNDLGWNDMGDTENSAEVAVTDLDSPAGRILASKKKNPATSAVRKQQERLAKNFVSETDQASQNLDNQNHNGQIRDGHNQNGPSASEKKSTRCALQAEKKVAFTLRLDPERHLKLRLACTLRGTSAQQFVTEAIDKIFDEINEIETLVAQIRQD